MKKILILHGWTYSTEKWIPFINLMKVKYDVELLKIPGLTERIIKVWDLDNYVEWLNRKIGSSKVILIGHSNGGRISSAFAAKYPGKVAKLILINSAGVYHNELPIRLKRFIFEKVAKIGRKITSSQILRKALYKLSRESDYEKASPIVRQTMNNLITCDLTGLFSSIKAPTLIIWGEEDKITPLKDGHLMHSLIKNSKLKIIFSAKHSPQFSSPKEVVKIINEFI